VFRPDQHDATLVVSPRPPVDVPHRRGFSILSPGNVDRQDDGEGEQPDWFADLLLDRLVTAVTEGYADHRLEPFFRRPLRDPAAIRYRQDVMRDVAREDVADACRAFSSAMRRVRGMLGQDRTVEYSYEPARSLLDGLNEYCRAVTTFSRELTSSSVVSSGFLTFRSLLAEYVESSEFLRLQQDTVECLALLGTVRYCLLIEGPTVTVCPYEHEDEVEFVTLVEERFEALGGHALDTVRVEVPAMNGMNHVQSQIVERLALLYPRPFIALQDYAIRYARPLDPLVLNFEREVQFYVAWNDYVSRFRESGLTFSYPSLTTGTGGLVLQRAFDVVLAENLVTEDRTVVTNDVVLVGGERLCIVTGPNHGGKTTFARMIGQIHHLANVGCSVPCAQASVPVIDGIFTHFERREQLHDDHGLLKEDLLRARDVLRHVTGDSLVIFNEFLSSTALEDAVRLGERILTGLAASGCCVVWVTFLDALAVVDGAVSFVAAVDEHDPSVRTFNIERRRADGAAHALAVAAKHRMTREWILSRLAR